MSVTENSPPTSNPTLTDLHRRYAGWLTAAVRRRDAALAEDIVQETFLRASAYAPDDLWRHPKALLLKIARSVMANAARDAGRKKRDPTGYAPEQWHYADQFQHVLLAETLVAIPQPYRDTFLLNRLAGMTYVEIAEAQSVSVKVVEWRVARALAICTKMLRD